MAGEYCALERAPTVSASREHGTDSRPSSGLAWAARQAVQRQLLDSTSKKALAGTGNLDQNTRPQGCKNRHLHACSSHPTQHCAAAHEGARAGVTRFVTQPSRGRATTVSPGTAARVAAGGSGAASARLREQRRCGRAATGAVARALRVEALKARRRRRYWGLR